MIVFSFFLCIYQSHHRRALSPASEITDSASLIDYLNLLCCLTLNKIISTVFSLNTELSSATLVRSEIHKYFLFTLSETNEWLCVMSHFTLPQ